MTVYHPGHRAPAGPRLSLAVLGVTLTLFVAGCGETADAPPPSGLESELRQIAATTTATPIYYLGAEFAGEVLSDVVIFNDDIGAEAEDDHSLDPGQSLLIIYGESCDAMDGTCSPTFEVRTEPFHPERYEQAEGCRRLSSLRGVPTVQQADAVCWFTAELVVRLGGTGDVPKHASAAATALREVGQDQSTDGKLPAPRGHIVSLVDKACGQKPGDEGPPIPR